MTTASAGFTINVMGDETEPHITNLYPTAIHPSGLEPSSPLAYSETVELPELRHSRAPVLLFVVAVVALAAAVAGWFLIRPHVAPPRPAAHRPAPTQVTTPPAPSPPDTVIAAPPPAPVQTIAPPAAAPPPVVVVPAPDPDATFIDQLDRGGIGFGNREAAIAVGHEICFNFSQGYDYQTEVDAAMQGRPSPLTRELAGNLVHAAVGVYCPQYSNQLGY